MSSHSSIEWTEVTWNPVTGCAEVNDGCKRCYAEWMAGRLRAMGVEKYRRGFEVAVHENALKEPLEWKRPRLVFVNSMSDLFHEAVSAEFVESVFDVMNRAQGIGAGRETHGGGLGEGHTGRLRGERGSLSLQAALRPGEAEIELRVQAMTMLMRAVLAFVMLPDGRSLPTGRRTVEFNPRDFFSCRGV